MRRLAWLVLVAGAIYLGVCYYPVGVKYLRLRWAAHRFAEQSLDGGQSWGRTYDFVKRVEHDTGLVLSTADVRVSSTPAGTAVEVRVDIPVTFRGIGTQHTHRFVIAAEAARPSVPRIVP